MIALNSPVALPNVTRLRVPFVDWTREEEGIAIVVVEAILAGAGQRQYKVFNLTVTDASVERVKANAGATDINNFLVKDVPSPAILGAFTALQAAWYGPANLAVRRRAAETAGLTAGWIDASLAGVVS